MPSRQLFAIRGLLLQNSELEGLELHISVLSPAIPIEFKSQADLLEKLRPGSTG